MIRGMFDVEIICYINVFVSYWFCYCIIVLLAMCIVSVISPVN